MGAKDVQIDTATQIQLNYTTPLRQ